MLTSSPAIPSPKKREHLSLPSEVPGALFSPDGTTNIIRFLEAVRAVVGRLLSDGYTLKDGRLLPPSPTVVLEPVPKTTEEK